MFTYVEIVHILQTKGKLLFLAGDTGDAVECQSFHLNSHPLIIPENSILIRKCWQYYPTTAEKCSWKIAIEIGVCVCVFVPVGEYTTLVMCLICHCSATCNFDENLPNAIVLCDFGIQNIHFIVRMFYIHVACLFVCLPGFH